MYAGIVTASNSTLTPTTSHLYSRDSLQMGSIAAAEVISHYGARPEADLRALVAEQLDPL